MATDVNDLKKQIFYEILNLAGRVFVHVRYSDDVVIGNRGFLQEEKEKGLVLVFNPKMNFEWKDNAISTRLVFGTIPQNCFIPADEILSVFSPELNAQFIVSPQGKEQKETKAEGTENAKKVRPSGGEKVVKVDFSGKSKK